MKILDFFKMPEKDDIEKNAKKNRLMRVNKFLSEPKHIAAIVIVLDIFAILIFNYLFCSGVRLPKWISSGGKTKNLFGITNAFSTTGIKSAPIIYLILLIALAVINIRYIYLLRTSYKDYNVGQKGTSKWTTLAEIREQYKEIPEKKEFYSGKGGVPVCRCDDKIYIDDSPVNNLIIGITRSGKGEMFVFPMIDIYSRAEKQPSLIITDPKLELYPSAAPTLEKRGYDVLVLNLVNPLQSMGFNPLQLVVDAYKAKDYSQAELLCSSFCYSIFNPDESNGDSQFWANNSTNCLSALILAHTDDCLKADEEINAKNLIDWRRKQKAFGNLSDDDQRQIRDRIAGGENPNDMDYIPTELEFKPTRENEKKINMYSILNTFSTLARMRIDDYSTALDVYFRSRPDLDRAKLKYSAIEVSGGKTKGSIFANTLAKLTVFTYEEIAKMTAESTVNLSDIGFGDKPIAIFLGIPDYDRSNHFIASVFIRQIYFVLAKKATVAPDGKCSREVVFILDEFGNMPAIESMANIATVGLGRNMRFNLVIQAYSQVEKIYGKDAETIIGNCGNQIYILTNDEETAKQYAALIGSETIVNINRSGGKLELGKNFTEMYEEHPLLNSNQLMELTPGECVVKRVMKRTDNNGNSVKPTPIYNTGKTNFKFRYQYLSDDFPTRSILDMHIDGREHIDLKRRTYDINTHFEKMQRRAAGEIDEEFIEVEITLAQTHCATEICGILKNLNLCENPEEIAVSDAIALLYNAAEKEKISKAERDSIIDLLI